MDRWRERGGREHCARRIRTPSPTEGLSLSSTTSDVQSHIHTRVHKEENCIFETNLTSFEITYSVQAEKKLKCTGMEVRLYITHTVLSY